MLGTTAQAIASEQKMLALVGAVSSYCFVLQTSPLFASLTMSTAGIIRTLLEFTLDGHGGPVVSIGAGVLNCAA